MRLFLGLPFPRPARREFLGVQNTLAQNAVKGNFTDVDNFHLTLVFLGEVEPPRLGAAFAALEAAPVPALELVFDGLGCFDGGIWHLRPASCPALMEGQARLEEALRREGFGLERREFVPHLTLARKLTLREGFVPPERLTPPIAARSMAARLFLSHRVEGALRYTPLEKG